MLGDLIPLALLGGLLGLDVVSFPQAMISRPLVAATLTGALVGAPVLGLLVGAALELIALETLPFGASRYPEWGSASVVGGALFATQPVGTAGSMAMAMLGALLTAWVGGWSMVKLRQQNARWAREWRGALEAGSRGAVIKLQLYGMTADFFRGALLTALSYAVLSPVTRAALASWGVDTRWSRAVVVWVAVSVMAAASWKVFHSALGAGWLFLGGLALGLVLLGVGL
jgi:PTS system mannose-specific IIC component